MITSSQAAESSARFLRNRPPFNILAHDQDWFRESLDAWFRTKRHRHATLLTGKAADAFRVQDLSALPRLIGAVVI